MNKFYLILIPLFLSGCFPKCFNKLCLSKTDYNNLILEGYNDTKINEILSNTKNCKHSYRTDEYICSLSAMKEAEKQMKKEEEEKERKKKQAEAEIEEKKRRQKELENKYGKNLCDFAMSFFTNNFSSNCMFYINNFIVIQQIDEGTLVTHAYYNKYGNAHTFLIEKNSNDADIIDQGVIPFGLFAINGKFKYINILGSPRTILKLKRLE